MGTDSCKLLCPLCEPAKIQPALRWKLWSSICEMLCPSAYLLTLWQSLQVWAGSWLSILESGQECSCLAPFFVFLCVCLKESNPGSHGCATGLALSVWEEAQGLPSCVIQSKTEILGSAGFCSKPLAMLVTFRNPPMEGWCGTPQLIFEHLLRWNCLL